MPETDAELLSAYARQGEVASLSALVSRHTAWLTAFLRSMLPQDGADDAFQEVWFRVIKSAQRFQGGSVKAYLAHIARSVAIDRLRRAGRMVSLDAEDETGATPADDLPSSAPLPDEMLETKATAADVRAAIQALPERERLVLLLHVEGELTFREIGDTLHIPLQTAITWAQRAIRRLKEQLLEQPARTAKRAASVWST